MSVNDIRKEVTTELFEVKEGSSEANATFIFGNEDHTLGNLLRHLLVQRPDVEFCGYSVPHPYEPKMNLRLQTHGVPAIKVLRAAIKDMMELCDDLESKYNAAVENFES